MNVPIAVIALVLTWMAKPENDPQPAKIDYRGLVLVTGGMALAVLGLQQSTTWGWDDPRTIGSIVIGVADADRIRPRRAPHRRAR